MPSKSIKELKRNARGQLIGRYNVCILVTLTVVIIQFAVTTMAEGSYDGSTASYLLRLLIAAVIDLLSGILVFGKSHFFLQIVRTTDLVSPKELFFGLKKSMDKAILIQSIYTVISLITSIPAILMSLEIIAVPMENATFVSLLLTIINVLALFVAKLFVGQSFYILNDSPDLSVPEIISKSIELMRNKKGRYVTIYLSSIPLALLSICAFGVGCFWFVAFFDVLLANFYLDAIGEEPKNIFKEKIIENAEEPIDSEHYSI